MRLNKIIFLPNVVLILRMLQQKAITNTLRIPERDSENIIASIVENVITISVKRKILRDFVIPIYKKEEQRTMMQRNLPDCRNFQLLGKQL